MKKKTTRRSVPKKMLDVPMGLLKEGATRLTNEAREQGSKLGAKLVYTASDAALHLLRKVTSEKRKVRAVVKKIKKKTAPRRKKSR